MKYEDRFDSLIQYHCWRLGWPLDWLLIKAQIKQESAFNPEVMSPAGAFGLMQLMPPTAKDLGVDITNMEENLSGGITYQLDQFNHFPEIPNIEERVRFALASYNGGRGYVNAAIRLAREKCSTLKEQDNWQHWSYTGMFLMFAKVRGKTPDSSQMIGYVNHILKHYAGYKSNHKKVVKELP